MSKICDEFLLKEVCKQCTEPQKEDIVKKYQEKPFEESTARLVYSLDGEV